MKFLFSLALGVSLCGFAPAQAQVATDDSALAALKKATPPAKAQYTVTPNATTTQTPKTSSPKPVTHKKPVAGKKPVPPPPPPVMPKAAPTNPVILPLPFVMPAHPPPPPPVVPLKADAPGSALPNAKGVRLIFGTNSSDLNPAMQIALADIATKLKTAPDLHVTITAFAPGTPQDPSTSRRLSLSRALAARAALIHAGIESDRIYARAEGFTGIGTDPADRTDLVLLNASQ